MQRKVYSVAELTRRIKVTLEDEIGSVWVEGEISNLSRPASGHMYFTLKDADAQIRGAMFRGNMTALKFSPRDGMKVRCQGELSVYEKRGEYQIIVRRIEEAGKGSLQEQFEKLKAQLQKEGLFDAARKRKLPVLPQRIGIVTSPTGAAIRDLLNILCRRFPNLHITLLPVKVQGEGSAQEVAAAIDLFNAMGSTDVMIVGRGGGSLEDLWAFNEEVVARAVARSTIPVISAVGHETDFTICDFVADLRAPTPSAAAELVVQPKAVFEEMLRVHARHLAGALSKCALTLKNRYTRAAGSYVFREPGHLVARGREQLLHIGERLAIRLRGAFEQRQQRVDELGMRLGHQLRLGGNAARQKTDRLAQAMLHVMRIQAQARRERLKRLEAQLRALGPVAVLERGYSITQSADGRVIRDAQDVKKGDRLVTRIAKGTVNSEVV